MPPAAPTGLTAVTDLNTIRLAWVDNSSNEEGFRIERSIEGRTYSEIGTVSANVTTYLDTGLDSDVTYCYRVTAFNAGGNSAYSNEACAAPIFTLAAVRVTPPVSYVVSEGAAVRVAITVEEVENLHGVNFNLFFNDAVLDLESVAETAFLETSLETPVPPGTFIRTLFLSDTGTAGVINISTALLGTDLEASGNGHIVWLTFTVPDTALFPTALTLEKVILVDAERNPIPSVSYGGTVETSSLPFDCDEDCDVDDNDVFDCFIMSWHCERGEDCFNPEMDCPRDDYIDHDNLFNLSLVWGATCAEPVIISCEPIIVDSGSSDDELLPPVVPPFSFAPVRWPGEGAAEPESGGAEGQRSGRAEEQQIYSTTSLREDRIVEASIVANQVTDLHGFNINLSFDSQKLEVMSVEKGDLIAGMLVSSLRWAKCRCFNSP